MSEEPTNPADTVTRTHLSTDLPGDRAGHQPPALPGYELRDEVGRGGMGVVFRARDLALDREVAVKVLLDSYGPNSAAARRFVEEAQITGQLQHPGIPAVHQTGIAPDGRPFMAMKLVKGRTLAEILNDRTDDHSASCSRLLGIFEHVCHAVGYAHAHAVIHRDLKPSNIMVGAFDEVQVMDWGLAKVLTSVGDRSDALQADDVEVTRTAIGARRDGDMATQAGSVLGTPAFMSPEQAGGESDKIDARADVFGLGAILCVILTGHPPYRGTTVEAVRLQAIRGQLSEAFARLDACGAEHDLIALAKRCLAALAERPAVAGEVADAVVRWRAASEERARKAERDRAAAEVRIAEQRKRRKVWYGLAGVLVLGTAASVALAIRASLAEGRAIEQRDLKEQARKEAVAADAARRMELGRTAAAAAELSAGRGRWDEAKRHFETALTLGAGDEVDLKLGHYDCLIALGQISQGMKELDEIADRSDLGRFAGAVLLRQAESALWRKAGGEPRDLARRAIAKGLSPADAAYAQVFLVDTAPEAIALLQEASRLDPFHRRGLDSLMALLLITGRRAEFRDVVTQMRMCEPGSVNHLSAELFLRSIEGDKSGAERALARLNQPAYAAMLPMLRALSEVLVAAQRDDFFLGGANPQQLAPLLTEYSKVASTLSGLAGEANPQDARIRDLNLFKLPMFQAMAEVPAIKSLTAANPLAALAVLSQPAKTAELFAAIANAIPDGAFLMNQGLSLQRAGKTAEAEPVLRRALEQPSWANHRNACRFHLMLAQAQLAGDSRLTESERSTWQAKALANARDLAATGSLPPDPTMSVVLVANAGKDWVLALALTESVLRQRPEDSNSLRWKLSLETKLKTLERADATALALLAIPDAKDDQRIYSWNAVLNLASAHRLAANPADALRWCDRVYEQLNSPAAAKLGRDELSDSFGRLGVEYWQLRRFDKSIAIFERKWEEQKKAKGELHERTLLTQVNLGVNYRDAGQLDKAIALLEHAELEGRRYEFLPWARNELLETYVLAGKATEGAAMAKLTIDAARKQYSANNSRLGSALAQVSHALLKLRAWNEAESVLRESLAIREKIEPDQWTTFNTKSMLGEALAGQKKYSQAESLLVQGYEGIKVRASKLPDVAQIRLPEAATRLVRLYDAWGKPAEAAKWRNELESLGTTTK